MRCCEIVLHSRIINRGLFVDRNKPYIAVSPDGIFSWKCHESYIIDIKCPFKFRDQFIKEEINDYDFLEIFGG